MIRQLLLVACLATTGCVEQCSAVQTCSNSGLSCNRQAGTACPRSGRCRIAVIGDSFTIGENGGGFPFHGILSNTLQRTCHDVVGFGASGKTTAAIKSEQWDTFVEGNGYDLIVGIGGANDFIGAVSAATATSNVTTIWDEVDDDGGKVVWLQMLPWAGYVGWDSERQTRTDTFNANLVTEAASRAWVTLLLTYAAFEDDVTADNLEADYDSGDGLHWNPAGRAIGSDTYVVPEVTP